MPVSESGSPSPAKLVTGFVASSAVLGLLFTGLTVPAVGALGTASESLTNTFQGLPEDLEEGPLPARTTFLFSDGTPMATIYEQNRVEVPLADIAPVMQKAVLAVEDSRFYQHNGVDPQGIFRAGSAKVFGGDSGGASTLTQQWVKNVLLDRAARAGDKEQIKALQTEDYVRKVREMRFALAAERKYSKNEILQNYLNIANYSDGAYGVEAASRYYYNKSAKDLNLPEAALLAGIVQRPTTWNPIKNPKNAKLRRDVVMKRMLEVNYITQEQYDKARKVTIESMLDVQPFEAGCEQAGTSGHFCDYVTKVITKDPHFVEYLKSNPNTPYISPTDLLYRGGLTVTTTLDKNMQNVAVEELIKRTDPATSSPDVGASMVSVEPGTGQIKMMAQNLSYAPGQSKDPLKTAINLNTNYEYGNSRGHQPGSNFKPIVLAHWMKVGRGIDETVSAAERTFSQSQFRCNGKPLSSALKPWRVGSLSKIQGMVTAAQATYASLNPAYAQMAAETDLCGIRDTAESMGVFLAAPNPSPPRRDGEDFNRLQITPSMALGVSELAPMTMAGAYAVFAAEGKYCKPIAISKITDRYGEEIPAPPVTCNQAISPFAANSIADAMSLVFTRGTARSAGPLEDKRPAAGKTGTTNNSVDAWFTGYTPDLSTSVWLGHVKAKMATLDKLTYGGKRYSRIYGSSISLPTWKAYTDRVLKDKPIRNFNPPGAPDTPAQGDQNASGKVPNVWNKPFDEARSILEGAGYSVKNGSSIASKARKGHAAGTSPRSGTSLEQGKEVVLYKSNGKPRRAKPATPTPAPPPQATPKKTAAPKQTAAPKKTVKPKPTPKVTAKPTPKKTTAKKAPAQQPKTTPKKTPKANPTP